MTVDWYCTYTVVPLGNDANTMVNPLSVASVVYPPAYCCVRAASVYTLMLSFTKVCLDPRSLPLSSTSSLSVSSALVRSSKAFMLVTHVRFFASDAGDVHVFFSSTASVPS